MIVKLLTEHHLEFLILKECCRGSFEPTLVKMSNCCKSHAVAHLSLRSTFTAGHAYYCQLIIACFPSIMNFKSDCDFQFPSQKYAFALL